MRHHSATPSILVAVIAMSGCSSALVHSSDLAPLDVITVAPAHDGSSANRVSHAELVALHETSVEEALRQLRPEWLRVRPSSRQVGEPAHASVYIDNIYAGGLEVLALVPASVVIDVRFLAASSARDQFGSGCRCDAGVILVATRKANQER